MVTEQIFLGMEIATKENLKKAKQTAKVNTHGQMVQYMLVNSRMALSRAKGGGNRLEKSITLINMKGNMLLIRSMDSVFSSGPVGTYIRVNILRMRDTALVR